MARLGLNLEIFISILSIRRTNAASRGYQTSIFVNESQSDIDIDPTDEEEQFQGRNMDNRDITQKIRNEEIIALLSNGSGSINHVAGCVLHEKG